MIKIHKCSLTLTNKLIVILLTKTFRKEMFFMYPVVERLYQHFVGHPGLRHWPEELWDHPVLGHRQYTLSEGLRPGFLLAAECMGPESLWP